LPQACDFSCTYARADHINAQVAAFVDQLRSGDLEVLVIAGANPAYSLPAAYGFAEAIRKVPLVIALTPFDDETARRATWVLPTNTPLESWGDYEPESGIVNLMQPVMGAMCDTREVGDILLQLAAAAGAPRDAFGATTFRDYLRRRWQGVGGVSFQQLLQRGGHWPEAPSPAMAPVSTPPAVGEGAPSSFAPVAAPEALSLCLYPMPLLYDGRSANKRWLQEVQDPVTHAVWTSWVEMHPSTAARLGLASQQVVEVRTDGGAIRARCSCNGVPEYRRGAHRPGRGLRPVRPTRVQRLQPAGCDSASRPFPAVRGRAAGALRIVSTDGAWGQHGRDSLKTVRPELRRAGEGSTGTCAGYPPMENSTAPRARGLSLGDGDRPEPVRRLRGLHAGRYAENNIGVVGEEWWRQAGRCTGSASPATSIGARPSHRPPSCPCCASTATPRRASRCAPSSRPHTAKRA
jgi:hypothetical protein